MPSGITFPLDELTFDTVTTGTYSVIDLNMLIVFGTSAGGDQLGRSRIRKFPTSSVLYIGRSSQGVRDGEVNFVDNSYITVYRFYPVMSKIPYIDPDGVQFMDSDLDFATYGAESSPVANGGPAFAATIDSGTSLITVNFDAGNSFVTEPGASIASYTWSVDDGTITVGTSASQAITVTFPAGFRYVNLLVADDNAEQHTCHIPVLAIDPAADPTVGNFQITRHQITPTGQELAVTVRSALDADDYIDGTLVMLIEDEPADADDRSNVLFTGFIQTDDADIGATPTGLLTDTVLNCVDVAGRLKALPGFSQVLEETASPSKWGEMTACNMDRFLHYMLQHQTTALDLADWTWSGTTTSYPFKILSSDGATLWEQVSRRAASLVPEYVFTCNRLGQLAVTIDPMLQDTGSRTSTVQAALDSDDYSDIRYTHQRPPRVHWLRANAIIASATTVTTAFCIAPGTAPSQGSSAVDDGENLAINQAGLNSYAGHKYARLNAFQSLLNVTLAASTDPGIDPAALTWVTLDLPAAVAAQRGLTLSTARTLCKLLECRYDNRETGLVRMWTAQLEMEVTSGVPATTETVVEATPVDDGGWGDVVTVSSFNNNLVSGQDVVGFITRGGAIYTCSDFTTAGEPTWSKNTSAATAAGISSNDLYTFVVDPFSPGYLGTPGGAINGWCAGDSDVWRVTDLFGTPAYTSVYTYGANEPNLTHEWAQIGASFGRYQVANADNPWLIVAYSAGAGANPIRTYISYSIDGGTTWSSEIDVSTFTRTAVQQERSWPALWLSPRSPGVAYVGAWESTGSQPDGGLFKTTDWGATWAASTDIAADLGQSIGFAMHVPWDSNPAEDIAYYGWFNRDTSLFKYRLYRSVAGVASDISPDDGGDKYGPARGLFSIRALDTNRQDLILAGVHDDTDNEEVEAPGSAAVSAIWRSSNGGDSWSRITSDLATTPNDDCVLQVAFSADDPDIFYGWGGHGYLIYTEDGGTMDDKSPTSSLASSAEIMGIFGGPTS